MSNDLPCVPLNAISTQFIDICSQHLGKLRVDGWTDGRTELVGPPLYPDCARRFLVEAFIMADCDVKKIEKALSERFSKLRSNSVSVLERGILLYLIVSSS